jgi:hypothetical protein
LRFSVVGLKRPVDRNDQQNPSGEAWDLFDRQSLALDDP